MKKTTNRKQQSGIATLVYIIFLTFLMTVVLATIQSRLLLSIKRTQSQSDVLISEYAAESQLHDYLRQLLGYSTISTPFTQTKTLSDGTRVEVTGTKTTSGERILVAADRPYATFTIEALREVITTTIPSKVDIILSLDCTGSMVETKACPTCVQTNLYEQRESAKHFVDLLRTSGADVRLGLATFGVNAVWAKTASGQQITPDSGVSLDEIYRTIENGFVLNPDGTWNGSTTMYQMPLCHEIFQGTSIGSAFTFSHDYFLASTTDRKEIEIVISDGVPNSSIPHALCPASIICPPHERAAACALYGGCNSNRSIYTDSYCIPRGRQFLTCALATADQHATGSRPKDIDAYMITVLDEIDPIDEAIFSSYSTKYYTSSDARSLTGFIEQVFGEIATSTGNFFIRRVVD